MHHGMPWPRVAFARGWGLGPRRVRVVRDWNVVPLGVSQTPRGRAGLEFCPLRGWPNLQGQCGSPILSREGLAKPPGAVPCAAPPAPPGLWCAPCTMGARKVLFIFVVPATFQQLVPATFQRRSSGHSNTAGTSPEQVTGTSPEQKF